jgi:hypothetical protein
MIIQEARMHVNVKAKLGRKLLFQHPIISGMATGLSIGVDNHHGMYIIFNGERKPVVLPKGRALVITIKAET